ncbi:MAG: hypothetical protein HOE83_23325 [Alphaproteobacteria bacterium]|jgi:hypothetical protein|nr:hypothetical protein [Alphaproteobacteria bacterium]
MKLTYWVAAHQFDSKCYSIRCRTKKSAVAEKEYRGAENYGPVVKVVVEYDNGFDLLEQITGEGGCVAEDLATLHAED